MRFRLPSLVVTLVTLGSSLLCEAQIFHVQGGGSTLFGASGGSINVKAPGYEGDIGLGLLDGRFQYGFLVRTKLMGNTLSVGDDSVKVDLPSDVFEGSHYFLARGVGLSHVDPKTKNRWYAFAGTTSLGYSTPFFMASRSEAGLGGLYFDRQLGSKFRFVSRNLFSGRQTLIQSIEWAALRDIKFSASGGVGSNQPYLAGAVRVDRDNFALRAAYIAEGTEFQRMQVPSPMSTEPERANIAAMYRITRRWSVRGSHQNILQPANVYQPTMRASVNEAYTNFNFAKFDFGAGTVTSHSSSRSNLGVNLYANRAINQAISLTANFYQSRPDRGAVSSTFSGMVREKVTQKLALTQTIVRSNGQNTASLGGEFVGNRLNAFIGYQTVYVPFRTQNPFQQALSFNAQINLPRNLKLTTASFVDPQGKVRYTFGIGTYLYRLQGMSGSSASAESFRFPRFVVAGLVLDENGQPFEGAAVKIDGKVAYSGSDGHFMIRFNRTGPYKVTVVMDEFIVPGLWDVVEAPDSISAQREEDATPIRIVLRRAPPKTPAPPPHATY